MARVWRRERGGPSSSGRSASDIAWRAQARFREPRPDAGRRVRLARPSGAVRDAARAYAQGRKPRVRDAYRSETFDRAIITEMDALGLLGATLPPEYGGAGLGYVAYGLAARAFEAVDSGERSAMSVQSSPRASSR